MEALHEKMQGLTGEARELQSGTYLKPMETAMEEMYKMEISLIQMG